MPIPLNFIKESPETSRGWSPTQNHLRIPLQNGPNRSQLLNLMHPSPDGMQFSFNSLSNRKEVRQRMTASPLNVIWFPNYGFSYSSIILRVFLIGDLSAFFPWDVGAIPLMDPSCDWVEYFGGMVTHSTICQGCIEGWKPHQLGLCFFSSILNWARHTFMTLYSSFEFGVIMLQSKQKNDYC